MILLSSMNSQRQPPSTIPEELNGGSLPQDAEIPLTQAPGLLQQQPPTFHSHEEDDHRPVNYQNMAPESRYGDGDEEAAGRQPQPKRVQLPRYCVIKLNSIFHRENAKFDPMFSVTAMTRWTAYP